MLHHIALADEALGILAVWSGDAHGALRRDVDAQGCERQRVNESIFIVAVGGEHAGLLGGSRGGHKGNSGGREECGCKCSHCA